MSDMTERDRLAANLSAERQRLGLSQAALADRMQGLGSPHWRQNTVSRVEKGTQDVTMTELAGLVQVLGRNLLDGTGFTVIAGSFHVPDDRAVRDAANLAASAVGTLYSWLSSTGEVSELASARDALTRAVAALDEALAR